MEEKMTAVACHCGHDISHDGGCQYNTIPYSGPHEGTPRYCECRAVHPAPAWPIENCWDCPDCYPSSFNIIVVGGSRKAEANYDGTESPLVDLGDGVWRAAVACGECLHSYGQLDRETCRRCGGTGVVPA